MLQDFHFKIIYKVVAKHANMDALSKNPVGKYGTDEDFGSEIQDLDRMAQDVSMSSTIKGIETINNLFTMIEGDTTPNHTEVQVQKGK